MLRPKVIGLCCLASRVDGSRGVSRGGHVKNSGLSFWLVGIMPVCQGALCGSIPVSVRDALKRMAQH